MDGPRNENAAGGEPAAQDQSGLPSGCDADRQGHDTATTVHLHSIPDDLKFVAAPLYEPAEWGAVYLDPHRQHWCLTGGRLLPVSRDRAGNWTTTRGEVLVFTLEGAMIRPADDPIIVPDLETEATILSIAAARLRAGRSLAIEDEARVALARRRLESARAEAARITGRAAA